MLNWEQLLELILNSIEIIGIFIAIIIGLIISKVMEIKKEKEILEEAIIDIDGEVNILKEKFEKQKELQFIAYKEDVIYEMIDSIYRNKKYKFNDDYPYVEIESQQSFYDYVNKYIQKILGCITDGINIRECKKINKVKRNSIDEIIIDDIYERNGLDD